MATLNPHPARQPGDLPYDYCKYHGLGNDYLVVEPSAFREAISGEAISALCNRHRGVGADGVLLGPLAPGHPSRGGEEAPSLRIYNPDGSEGEKSGNGLRIFARYLWERGYVRESPFEVQTVSGRVRARVLEEDGSRIAMEMGAVVFDSGAIPMLGPPREVLRETLVAAGRSYLVNAANIGNPHCVVLTENPTEELARSAGPHIEKHESFPNRTNVQFMSVLDRHRIRIEIWERGAGYTQASGTSSIAASAVACRLGLCESPVTVSMPGGELEIRLQEQRGEGGQGFRAEMEGDVRAVGCGRLADDLLAALNLSRG